MLFLRASPNTRRPGCGLLPVAMATLVFVATQGACSRPTVFRIGEQFSLGDLSYTVKERRSQGQFVIPLIGEGLDAGRDATFFIVRLEITSHARSTSAITLSSVELEAPGGLRYKPDLRGSAARAAFERSATELRVDDPRGALLRPRIPTPFTVVFRVPYRVASENLILIVHQPAALFGGRAAVALQ